MKRKKRIQRSVYCVSGTVLFFLFGSSVSIAIDGEIAFAQINSERKLYATQRGARPKMTQRVAKTVWCAPRISMTNCYVCVCVCARCCNRCGLLPARHHNAIYCTRWWKSELFSFSNFPLDTRHSTRGTNCTKCKQIDSELRAANNFRFELCFIFPFRQIKIWNKKKNQILLSSVDGRTANRCELWQPLTQRNGSIQISLLLVSDHACAASILCEHV